MEPTYSELLAAYVEALNNQHSTIARSETREKLIQLRVAKHTWIGVEQNDLRFSIDSYLRQFCRCSDGPFHYESCPFFTNKNAFADLGTLIMETNQCKGTNCAATDGISHSPECKAEHELLVNSYGAHSWASDDFATYNGWKCHVCGFRGQSNTVNNQFCASCHRHK